MSQFSDSFVVLRRHYTEIILLRARLQLLGDSMTHLVRSGIKRMVYLFCKCNDLQILNVKGLRKKKDIMVDF